MLTPSWSFWLVRDYCHSQTAPYSFPIAIIAVAIYLPLVSCFILQLLEQLIEIQ